MLQLDIRETIKSACSLADSRREVIAPQVLAVGCAVEGWARLDRAPVPVNCVETLEEALPLIKAGDYAVAVFSLSRFSGEVVPFLHNAREAAPVPVFILLADSASEDIAVDLANAIPGVICLPASSSLKLIHLAIERAIQDHEKKQARNKSLEASINGTLAAFVEILSLVDPYSASLGQRLRYAVEAFTKAAGIPPTWELETAAIIGEIGVLTIPVRVLLKHNSGQDLSSFEKELMARVPERGADLLQQIPFLQPVSRIVRYQQKHFDGAGFPSDSMAGERLPIGSRIIKLLADLFRLEDGGLTRERALEQMESTDGKYDPTLIEAARACSELELHSRVPATAQLVTLKELRPGHLLAAGIDTKDGVLLIREGQLVSPRIIHKLRNFACISGIREPIHVIDLLESRGMVTVFQDLAHSETTLFTRNGINLASEFVA